MRWERALQETLLVRAFAKLKHVLGILEILVVWACEEGD